jgi:DNA repair protein RadC
MNHSFTTKELPESERPYEKFWKYGATALSDAELLAIVIKSGSSKMTAVDVARSFLSQKDRNLMNLYEMSYDEMKKIHGIGDVIAMQLKCIAELSTRIANTRHFEGIQMRSAATVAEYYMEQLRHEQQEKLIVCMFDSKCKWLGDSVVTTGSVSSSIVPPREIFICALELLVIIYSSSPERKRAVPSGEDNTVTARIAEAGKLLGIALSDHIIIGDRTYFSYREAGYLT